MSAIESVADLPADGCVTIRGWEYGSQRRGWHVERVVLDLGDTATVSATPMSITAGIATGEPRNITLAFGLDEIEAMP